MTPTYALFYGVEISTFCIAIICFTLRSWSRNVKKILSFDDAVLFVATCMSISMTAMVWQLYHLGYGIGQDPVENLYPIAQIRLALLCMFPMCYSLIRVSILLTYLKLFPTQTNRWLCWILSGLQIVFSLWAGVSTLRQCSPINAYWDKTIEGQVCNSTRNEDIAILSLNSIFDVVVYVWPVHYLYRLRLPLKTRAELIIIFSLGLINLIGSFSRLVFVVAVHTAEQWKHSGPRAFLIIVVQAHVGITCASLHYLRFIFEYISGQVSTNALSKTPYGISKDRTKAKNSGRNHVNHPFVELDVASDRIIQRKTDIEISMSKGDEIEEDIGMANYGGRSTVMEDQMRRDERAWSGEHPLLEDKPGNGPPGIAR